MLDAAVSVLTKLLTRHLGQPVLYERLASLKERHGHPDAELEG
ncbi:MAG: hypothetical protein RMK60_02385 [Burkholderiales bacterium]|nr:hypothetical protein [Burkholderiales bacterium]